VGTDVILWGPYDGTGFSSGVDDVATWSRIPDQFGGYVWTNKVEAIDSFIKSTAKQNGD
jgi:glycerophosphoryl diester phosphodiesterase